jgi:hypothetical protein
MYNSLYHKIWKVSQNHGGWLHYKMKQICCQLYYKRRSLHRNIYKTITFTFPLLNVIFSQSGLQEVICFLECHPTCPFRILFLPVLDVVRCAGCAKTQGNPLRKTTSEYTIIDTGMYIMISVAKHRMVPNWKQWHLVLHDDLCEIFCAVFANCAVDIQ